MIRANHTTTLAARAIGLAALLFGLSATPAAAAPSFEVELERDTTVVRHSDERVDYTVKVRNISAAGGAASVGDLLLCNPDGIALPGQGWLPPEDRPVISYQWWRNGEEIAGATSNFYTVTAAEAGKAVQCLVKGSNGAGAAVSAALPAAVINPQPAVEPPKPSSPTEKASRPAIKDETGKEISNFESVPFAVKRFCHPPANWTAGTTYTFQWLLNGQEIDGAEAETSAYQPVAADEGKILQCRVIGTNAGGSVVGLSELNQVGVVNGEPPLNIAAWTPSVIADPTTVTVELPGGEETFVNKVGGEGWICRREIPTGTQHAKAICASRDKVAPGGSYPTLTIVVALDKNAPDLAVARATVTGGGSPEAAVATDEFIFAPEIQFGITAFEAQVRNKDSTDFTQAGGHPFEAFAKFVFSAARGLSGGLTPIGHPKVLITDTPRGFVGNALAVPELCPTVDDVINSTCPPGSAIGGVVINPDGGGTKFEAPIYALEPEFGIPVAFGFSFGTGAYNFFPRLRAEDGYAITFETAPFPVAPEAFGAEATICSFGAKLNGGSFIGCKEASDPSASPKPLVTNPTRCAGPPPITRTRMNTWERPEEFVHNEAVAESITGCEQVKFEPQMQFQPTNHSADSPTGLDVELTMPTEGLEGKNAEGKQDPGAISQANLKRAVVTFPEGMSVNPSAGHGLKACSAEQVKLKTNLPHECPDASKIGTIAIDTPLIQETLRGAAYVAKQGDVDGATIGMYLVFESARDGIIIKLPGKAIPDPVTGQLTVTFDESPEAPFSAVRMHFFGGSRATLITPPTCGTYEITAKLSPWTAKDLDNPTSQESVEDTSTFEVTSGPGGSPCPSGALEPKLSAGTQDPTAGQTSPFVMRLHREDGTDRFSSLKLNMPPGLTAYLTGVPYCPDAVLAAIPSALGTGQGEIDSPSCPAASQVGTVTAGAGAGPDPFYVNTAKAYLAGPYKGAPLSVAVVAPAVAGPLDLGNVVVRNALHLNPETAQASVISDPIPTILHGLMIDVRDIRIEVNRPRFTLNPTSCEEMAVGVEVKGERGSSASASSRFQANGCEKLKFKPKLSVRLFGGTARGANPRLRAVLTAAPGEANIGRAAVTIPTSEFLDQAHIRTICTRVQFAADACPKGSIYGRATAITPLLDYPVKGPVYLRSSDNQLPDLVVNLHGPAHQPVEAVVVGRIDSTRGQVNTIFETAPDVPLTKFTLTMQGGQKGLLVNSRNICASRNRATVKLTGHNGKVHSSRPELVNGKCKQERRAERKRR